MSNSGFHFPRWNRRFCLLAVLAWTLAAAVAELPGTKLWEYDTGGTQLTSPALAADETVYFCFTISNTAAGPGGRTLTYFTNKLTAVRADGSRHWETGTPVGGNIVIGGDQTIFLNGERTATVPGPGGRLFTARTTAFLALNAAGTILWQRAAPNDFALSSDGNLFAVYSGRNIFNTNIAFDSSGFTVASLDSNGLVRWETQSATNLLAKGMVVIDPNGTSHLNSEEPVFGTIQAPGGYSITVALLIPQMTLVAETGESGTPFASRYFFNPVFSARGEVLAPSRQFVTNIGAMVLPSGQTTNVPSLVLSNLSSFSAFDSSGQLLWDSGVTSSNFSPAVVAADGTIYVGSVESNLYAISASGALKWQFAAGAAITASPALAGDGTIYFGTEAGVFYALTTNATVDWQFTAGGPIRGAPVIGPTGVVYFGSEDGKLYAFQGWAALARSPWPMFRHDPAHTGRAFQVGLRSERSATNGAVQLRLNLEKNASYRLEFSTNLVDWQPWTNVTSSTGGVLRVNAPIDSGTERRFYRLQGTP